MSLLRLLRGRNLRQSDGLLGAILTNDGKQNCRSSALASCFDCFKSLGSLVILWGPTSVNSVLKNPSRSPGQNSHSWRSEEHTSELQSPDQLVCRLLLEKKK